MTKLTNKTVINGLSAIAVNFELKPNSSKFALIGKLLKAENFSEKEFKRAVNGILLNETTSYNKMPPIAVFIKYGRPTIPIEEEA